MFAYRSTFIIKHGRMEEALKLSREEAKRYDVDYAKVRCYTPSCSPNFFVWELIVENEEARNKFYADLYPEPVWKEFWAKWGAVSEREVGMERWEITELL